VLDHNALTALEGVGALARLERLSASRNALAALPGGIGKLRRLRELNVAGNRLAALPGALGRCESLELLDAADNCLRVRAYLAPAHSSAFFVLVCGGCTHMHGAERLSVQHLRARRLRGRAGALRPWSRRVGRTACVASMAHRGRVGFMGCGAGVEHASVKGRRAHC
jgi:hypothetical protein